MALFSISRNASLTFVIGSKETAMVLPPFEFFHSPVDHILNKKNGKINRYSGKAFALPQLQAGFRLDTLSPETIKYLC
jgi:hypothetical protein